MPDAGPSSILRDSCKRIAKMLKSGSLAGDCFHINAEQCCHGRPVCMVLMCDMLCRLPNNGHDGDIGDARLGQGGQKQTGEDNPPLLHPLLQPEQDTDASNTQAEAQ